MYDNSGTEYLLNGRSLGRANEIFDVEIFNKIFRK